MVNHLIKASAKSLFMINSYSSISWLSLLEKMHLWLKMTFIILNYFPLHGSTLQTSSGSLFSLVVHRRLSLNTEASPPWKMPITHQGLPCIGVERKVTDHLCKEQKFRFTQNQFSAIWIHDVMSPLTSLNSLFF